jgi:hypothetical protein
MVTGNFRESERKMITIHKYVLTMRVGHQIVSMPKGAIPRCVAMQGSDLCMWCEVDTEAPMVGRSIRIFYTGESLGVGGLNYFATILAYDAGLVLHVFI